MSCKRIDGFSPTNVEAGQPSNKNCKLTVAITAAVLLCLGSLVVSYFWDPTFHTFINQIPTEMAKAHLTVGQSLLFIALPIGGISVAVGAMAHIYRTHQKNVDEWQNYPSMDTSWRNTLKEMNPTPREWKIIGIVAAVLVVLGVVGFGVFQYVPQANELICHPIQLWQALAYVGGGAAGTALLIGGIIATVQCHREQQEELKKMRGIEDDLP